MDNVDTTFPVAVLLRLMIIALSDCDDDDATDLAATSLVTAVAFLVAVVVTVVVPVALFIGAEILAETEAELTALAPGQILDPLVPDASVDWAATLSVISIVVVTDGADGLDKGTAFPITAAAADTLPIDLVTSFVAEPTTDDGRVSATTLSNKSVLRFDCCCGCCFGSNDDEDDGCLTVVTAAATSVILACFSSKGMADDAVLVETSIKAVAAAATTSSAETTSRLVVLGHVTRSKAGSVVSLLAPSAEAATAVAAAVDAVAATTGCLPLLNGTDTLLLLLLPPNVDSPMA